MSEEINLIVSQIKEVNFDIYTPEEIRKSSVKQITNASAFDKLGRPVLGGLYDPAMGVSPYDKTSLCETCGKDSVECPGHFGHIELPACVYNPFAIGYISKLLGGKCHHCNRLRIREKEKNFFYIKLLLIKLGLINEAKEFESIIFNTLQKDDNSAVDGKIKKLINSLKSNNKYEEDLDFSGIQSHERERRNSNENGSISTQSQSLPEVAKEAKIQIKEEKQLDKAIKKMSITMSQNKEKHLDELFKKVSDCVKVGKKNASLNDQNTDIQLELKKTLKDFWKSLKLSKCPHCKSHAHKIKKQGYLKFFELPISKKAAKANKFLRVENKDHQIKDETDEDEEDKERLRRISMDARDEVAKEMQSVYLSDKKKKDEETRKQKNRNLNEETDDNDGNINLDEAKFIHPEAVRERIKLLWNRDGDLLSLVFGNVFKKASRSNIFSIESSKINIFFLDTLLVPPIRFRPENRSGGEDSVYLHNQSVIFTRILNVSFEMKQISDSINKRRQSSASKDSKESDNHNNKNLELEEKNSNFKDLVAKWIDLQDLVNILYDGMKASKLQEKDSIGIRQILEKKEGIFRMKMMGKRVNYAGRSVISPDPMISTGEVGIPLYIAGKLTIPEYVTNFNKERLKQLIINGAFKYPGANMVETIYGKKLMLDTVKDEIRINKLAKSLDSNDDKDKFKVKIVYRHLQTGDALLVNRQPTLHKPSIMSHKAKVLKGEKTIRLHYSNCSSYNADFDGDEMNIHLLQNQIARQEAYSISNTENQYIVPTSGNPIRGLIQDSIIGAVLLTLKDNFFNRADFFQIVYSALESPLNSGKISQIIVPEPCIIKPKMLWSGKQIITCILKSLVSNHQIFGIKSEKVNFVKEKEKYVPHLNLESKSRLKEIIFGEQHKQETIVTIRGNELLTGIIDKNQIGNSAFGIVHSYYEIYGSEYAGELLTVLGRLFINYLQSYHGFTCGVGDLLINDEMNLKRRVDIENVLTKGIETLADMFEINNFKLEFDNISNRVISHTDSWYEKEHDYLIGLKPDDQEKAKRLIRQQHFIANKNIFKDHQSQITEIEEKILIFEEEIKGINKKINSKTKEEKISAQNHISQLQEKIELQTIRLNDLKVKIKNNHQLENLRTKLQEKLLIENDDSIEKNIDNSVKFAISDGSKVINNWLNQGLKCRFPKNFFSLMTLSGAKGSEFNHIQISCQLGQQELEGRRVPRMACGKTLPSFDYFDPNPRAGGYISDRFGYGIRPQEFFFHCMAGREGLIDTAVKTSRSGYLQRCLIKHLEQLVVNYDNTVRDTDGKVIQFLYGEDCIDPINSQFLSNYNFLKENLDSYHLKYQISKIKNYVDNKTVRKYLENRQISDSETIIEKFNPAVYIGSKSELVFDKLKKYLSFNYNMSSEDKNKLKQVMDLKYFKSLIQPGENVGILAAQSIGEPSTQMTLNTFHLAGHGGTNMTLGIPRMREILMTSEKNIKTPFMYLIPKIDNKENTESIARMFEESHLIDIVKEVKIITDILPSNDHKFERVYNIEILLEKLSDIKEYFGNNYNPQKVSTILYNKFIPALDKLINKHYKQAKNQNAEAIAINKTKMFDEFNENIAKANKEDKEDENDNQEPMRKRSDSASEKSEKSEDIEKEKEEKDEIQEYQDDLEEEENETEDNKMEVEDVSDDDIYAAARKVPAPSQQIIINQPKRASTIKEEDKVETKFIKNKVFSKENSNFKFSIFVPYTQKPILVKK